MAMSTAQPGGTAFNVQGSALDRDSLLLEAGLDVGLSARHRLGLGYTGEVGSASRNHAGPMADEF